MKQLPYSELLKLKRWNTPTIYNGWEMITKHDRTRGNFNLDPVTDYMPQMGVMVGYAVTVVCEPSNPAHKANKQANDEYMRYLASIPGPKIAVVQDLDKPVVGSFWGEINANMHKGLGCIGTITDGAIRDSDEMANAGFKAIARRMCVGHAYSTPVRWGCDVEVFGCTVKPGQLIHADKHGFMLIDEEDYDALYDAVCFMDANECNHMLQFMRNANGLSKEEFVEGFARERDKFEAAWREKFGRK